MIGIITSALILGLAGSLHCVGMCGPLVLRLHTAQAKNKAQSLWYYLGKTFTYAIFGLIGGSIGHQFAFMHWQQRLSIIAGIVLLLMTFFPRIKGSAWIGHYVTEGFVKLQQQAYRIPNSLYLYLSGMLNGLLPCGLVYAALAASLATSGPLPGALFMTFFGLGTVPALFGLGMIQQNMNHRLKWIFSNTSFYLSVLVGVCLILRGLNLGIPYVSPKLNAEHTQMSCCERK